MVFRSFFSSTTSVPAIIILAAGVNISVQRLRLVIEGGYVMVCYEIYFGVECDVIGWLIAVPFCRDLSCFVPA